MKRSRSAASLPWRLCAMPALAALLCGCASTTVELTPSPQPPVCDARATAQIRWAPQWRADQKDVAERERAAVQGLQSFATQAGCFASADVRRVADAARAPAPADGGAAVAWVVGVVVRELGPVLRLGASPAGVEGGTEVVLDLVVQPGTGPGPVRRFRVHWRHGGPGVVKGVATLPADLHSALVAALQPAAAR